MKPGISYGAALLFGAAVAAMSCYGTGGASPPSSRDALLDPASCQPCHADHYRDWSTSMHAKAADDPIFLAMMTKGQRETDGGLGSLCVTCHAPLALSEGATTDGLNLATVPQKLKGVTCFFCHSIDDVKETHNGAMHVASDGVMRGASRDPLATAAHGSAYSSLHDRDHIDSSKMCGSCHDLVDGPTPYERLFDEWQASVYSHAAGGATCGQCHMAQSTALAPIAQVAGAQPRRSHDHGMPALHVPPPGSGADAQTQKVQSLLDTTLQSAVCVGAGRAGIHVLFDNVAAGHNFPSGIPMLRRAWVEVVAYAGGQVIYQSGVVPDGTPVSKIADPDLWSMRDCMLDTHGTEVIMPWLWASYESFTLPAQTTFDQSDPRYYQTHVYRSFPKANALSTPPDRVTMRVRVQPIGLEVLDELVASGDLDPAVRAGMPTLDTAKVEWTPAAAKVGYAVDRVDYACVTMTNFNYQADKVPAPAPKTCAP